MAANKNNHLLLLFEESLKQYEVFYYKDNIHKYYRLFHQQYTGMPVKDVQNHMYHFLLEHLKKIIKTINLLNTELDTFKSEYFKEKSSKNRDAVIIKYCKLTGTKKSLRKDIKALKRNLDVTAVEERYLTKINQKQHDMKYLINRCSFLHDQYDMGHNITDQFQEISYKYFILSDQNDVKICVLKGIRKFIITNTLYLPYKKIIEQLIKESDDDWLISEALYCMSIMNNNKCAVYLSNYILDKKASIFIRHRAILQAGTMLNEFPSLYEALKNILPEKSAYVKQALAMIIPKMDDDNSIKWIGELINNETDTSVRAQVLLCIRKCNFSTYGLKSILNILEKILKDEESDYILKTSLNVISDILIKFNPSKKLTQHQYHNMVSKIILLKKSSKTLPIRRYCGVILERLWCEDNAGTKMLKSKLKEFIKNIPLGKSRKIPYKLLKGVDSEIIGRVLALICVSEFGLDVRITKQSIRVRRGIKLRKKLWRVINEFLRLQSQKRQDVSHAVSRDMTGNIRIPSKIMCEASPTNVPGEPLLIDEEKGWRPYLPLVADMLPSFSITSKKEFKLYTPDGITKVYFPRSILSQLKSYLKISWNFRDYSRMRDNINTTDPVSMKSYLNTFKKMGYTFEHIQHNYLNYDKVDDDSIKRFFPTLIPISFKVIWYNFIIYYFSVFSNTLPQLFIFLIVFTIFIIFINKRNYTKIKRNRDSIPLVIGGWGTRGKSSVERLKAAIFQSLYFKVASKVSGCQSSLLLSTPNNELIDISLYRSHDKASIWEQKQAIGIASYLGSTVFLWEVMAIRPRYAKYLQQQWMRDHYSTVTNTYPDHEDQQGPAGYNVAQSISEFLPFNAEVISTEAQFLPVIEDRCMERGSNVLNIDPESGNLVPDDILQKLPYRENTANIALVLGLSEKLEIPYDVALKGIVDNLKPDTGSFRIFPQSILLKRKLQFINSMSANERYSTLENLRKINYFDYDIKDNPDIWLMLVVNNRRDRGPRMQAFVKMLVDDLTADRYVIIGSNLNGFKYYLNRSWIRSLDTQITTVSSSTDGLLSLLDTFSHRLRISTSKETIKARIQIIHQVINPGNSLYGANNDNIDNIIENINKLIIKSKIPYAKSAVDIQMNQLLQYHQYHLLREEIKSAKNTSEMKSNFKKIITEWFMHKFIYVDDLSVLGDDLNLIFAKNTPPWCRSKVIGIENIKGPGMSLFYTWDNWLQCFEACQYLDSDKAVSILKGLEMLGTIPSYSILTHEYLKKSLDKLSTTFKDNREIAEETKIIQSKLERCMKKTNASKTISLKNKIIATLLRWVEDIFEPVSAAVRKTQSKRIYRDLKNRRISYHKAALEIQRLNIRQKNGWLYAKYFSKT